MMVFIVIGRFIFNFFFHDHVVGCNAHSSGVNSKRKWGYNPIFLCICPYKLQRYAKSKTKRADRECLFFTKHFEASLKNYLMHLWKNIMASSRPSSSARILRTE